MVREQNGNKENIKTGNKSSESVTKFKYFAEILTNEECMREDRNGRLNSKNACCHSVHTFLVPVRYPKM